MNKAPKSDRRFIEGPVGRLESTIDAPEDISSGGSVVVCHPHPQHGGTMHNKVVYTVARSFVRMGFVSLRFNFRGTEASDGHYDHGHGELDDALAAIEWMRAQYPNEPLWLAGFSFGAAIAIRASIAVEVSGLVSVAPAVDGFGNDLAGQPRCPWLVLQGDKDEVIDVDLTLEWVNSLEPGPELLVMSGAGHFFHGKLVDLRLSVTEFVERHRVKPCL